MLNRAFPKYSFPLLGWKVFCNQDRNREKFTATQDIITREQLLLQLVPEATTSYSASIVRDTGIVEQRITQVFISITGMESFLQLG